MGQWVLGCNKGKGHEVLGWARDTWDPGGSKGHCVLAKWRFTGCSIWPGHLHPKASAGPGSYISLPVQQMPGEWPIF